MHFAPTLGVIALSFLGQNLGWCYPCYRWYLGCEYCDVGVCQNFAFKVVTLKILVEEPPIIDSVQVLGNFYQSVIEWKRERSQSMMGARCIYCRWNWWSSCWLKKRTTYQNWILVEVVVKLKPLKIDTSQRDRHLELRGRVLFLQCAREREWTARNALQGFSFRWCIFLPIR